MTSDIKNELKEIIYEAYQAHSHTTSNLYGSLQKEVTELKNWRKTTMVAYGVGQSLVLVIVSMAVWVFFSELNHIKETFTLQINGTNERVEQLINVLERSNNKGLQTLNFNNEELRAKP